MILVFILIFLSSIKLRLVISTVLNRVVTMLSQSKDIIDEIFFP